MVRLGFDEVIYSLGYVGQDGFSPGEALVPKLNPTKAEMICMVQFLDLFHGYHDEWISQLHFFDT